MMAEKPLMLQLKISYPCRAEAGKAYLVTVDLDWIGGNWHYEDEEYLVYCLIDCGVYFECKSLDGSVIILHRMGGSYGSAKFLIAAVENFSDAELKINFINKWGVPLDEVRLSCTKLEEPFDPSLSYEQKADSSLRDKENERRSPSSNSSIEDVSSEFLIRFWGVRGVRPSPGHETMRYGGNTICVEMLVSGQRLIFDAGTGICSLGRSLLSEVSVEAHIFFSHSHWGHIQGFRNFEPAFKPGNTFHIYGSIAPTGATIEQRLNDQMMHPNFPVPLQVMGSVLSFTDVEVGLESKESVVELNDVLVESMLLNHPGEALGYRVTFKGLSVAYITDTEHFPDRLDENVLLLSRDVDVMIYDATYTDEEYHNEKNSKVGWGHSTWQEALKIAKAANVKKVVLFHHEPTHDDNFLDDVQTQASQYFSDVVVAYEGLEIDARTLRTRNFIER